MIAMGGHHACRRSGRRTRPATQSANGETRDTRPEYTNSGDAMSRPRRYAGMILTTLAHQKAPRDVVMPTDAAGAP